MVTGALAVAVAILVAVVVNVGAYFAFNAGLKDDPRLARAAAKLEMAAIGVPVTRFILLSVGAATTLWVLASIALRWSLVTSFIALPIVLVVCGGVVTLYVRFKAAKRLAMFMDQLEIALRLVSSGIRVGLSLQQAVTSITEELNDPARSEFARVVRQTRLGVPMADALDDLAQRIPCSETVMLARVIRVQTQTGGSLSVILDHLAETIKGRRRIARKIDAITAEGRMGAMVLEALPIFVGLFIMVIERPMGEALLGTFIGHLVLGWVALLETLAIIVLNRMLKVNA